MIRGEGTLSATRHSGVRHRLRLLLLIDSLGSGGAQRQIVNLAVGLTAKGHEVTVARYAPGDHFLSRLANAGVATVFLRKSARFALEPVKQLRRLVAAQGLDAVVSFLQTPNIYNILAARTVPRRPRIIVSERSYDPPNGPSPGTAALRQLYRAVDRVVFNSHHQRRRFEAALPWIRQKGLTIYNGVDLEEFRPPSERVRAERLLLLTMGRVSPSKNGMVLVEALRRLRDAGLSAQVRWIGQIVRSPPDHYKYYLEMCDAIKDYRLDEVWHWLPPQADVRRHLWEADALVHPSYGEGLPNVACEALACGLPVIISDTLDHPLLVRHGETGFLFQAQNAADLVTAVMRFASLSAAERHLMERAARDFATAYLSMPRMIDAFEDLLLGVVGPPAEAT